MSLPIKLVLACISIGVFALFILAWSKGNPKRHGFLDVTHRMIFVSLPSSLRAGIMRLLGESGVKKFDDLIHYVTKTNNCLVQVFYIGLVLGLYYIFVTRGHPHFPTESIPEQIVPFTLLFVMLCVTSFFIVCTADPGRITPGAVASIEKEFPYDKWVFPPGATCRTCQIPKPARSKHCRLCNRCVSRFDHHCIWLGNCVGEGNHHQFITFLALHVALTGYATLIPLILCRDTIRSERLWSARFVDPATGETMNAGWSVVIRYLLGKYDMLLLMGLMCFVLFVVLLGFTSWHVYAAAQGVTTNERDRYKHSRSRHLIDVIRECKKEYLRIAGPRAEDDPNHNEKIISFSDLSDSELSSSDSESEEDEDEKEGKKKERLERVLVKYKLPTSSRLRGHSRREAKLAALQVAAEKVDALKVDPAFCRNVWHKGKFGNLKAVFCPKRSFAHGKLE